MIGLDGCVQCPKEDIETWQCEPAKRFHMYQRSWRKESVLLFSVGTQLNPSLLWY